MFRRFIFSLIAAVAMPLAAFAVIPGRPSPQRLVNDLAAVLPAWQADSLERALVAFDDSTSNQIAVVTVGSLDGMSVTEYALRLGNSWGVGSTRNNGIVVLLKPRGDDGYVDVTIQVGRGLEGAIPDVYASRIIRNVMGPHLRKDEYMPAVSKACRELQALAAGEYSVAREDDEEDLPLMAGIIVFLFIVFVIYIAIKADEGNNRGNSGGRGGGGRPIVISHGPSMGGFGSFGGGHSGGFGGFGGGSFGGGGASGRF